MPEIINDFVRNSTRSKVEKKLNAVEAKTSRKFATQLREIIEDALVEANHIGYTSGWNSVCGDIRFTLREEIIKCFLNEEDDIARVLRIIYLRIPPLSPIYEDGDSNKKEES